MKFKVEGMGCMKCVQRVKDAIEKVKGVESAEVSLEDKTADVIVSAAVKAEEIINAVVSEGYSAEEM